MNRPSLSALLEENHARFEQTFAKANLQYLTTPFPDDWRFLPERIYLTTLAGTYIDDRQRTLTFHMKENCLIIQTWRGQEMPGLALDAVRFAYNKFGLVTFQLAPDGTVPTLEWWNQLFYRVGN